MGTKLAGGIRVGEWVDISGMLDAIRLVKSLAEQTYMRLAAKAADAGTQAAIDAIHDGAPESEVAAECLAAMTRAGSTPPGFGPFLRPLPAFHKNTHPGALELMRVRFSWRSLAVWHDTTHRWAVLLTSVEFLMKMRLWQRSANVRSTQP